MRPAAGKKHFNVFLNREDDDPTSGDMIPAVNAVIYVSCENYLQ